jgi:glycosyltransferase involved in cell wall biosynthesis
VLPILENQVGAVHLHIAGSNPTRAVQALAADMITVHGYVSDESLIELYRTSDCAIVPLRFGAGVKGKVLEAIQYGIPLVTTSVGAEGIPDAHKVMAIADEPEAFAQAVISCVTTDSLNSHPQSRRWLEDHYSAKRAEEAIHNLFRNTKSAGKGN